MKRFKATLILTSLAGALFLACSCAEDNCRNRISLDGEWTVTLNGEQHEITLPGTTDLAGLGEKNMDTTSTFSLSRRFLFTGKALYSKHIIVPESWEGSDIILFMERTKPSEVFVDGVSAGSNDNISTPQIYNLSEILTPGEHIIEITVDNGYVIPEQVINSSHAFSSSTQTNWNGIIGSFYLESRPAIGIEDHSVKISPDWENGKAIVEVPFMGTDQKLASSPYTLRYKVFPANAKGRHAQLTGEMEVDLNSGKVVFEILLGKKPYSWSEFSPVFYKLKLELRGEEVLDKCKKTFGLRSFGTEGRQFRINDKITFLRGKHDACVFPLTAHTAMDVETWRRYFRIGKEYGINYWRFHSWCPPEACFTAADLEGVYLQPELPMWGFIDIEDRELMEYLKKEGRNILDTYGNHPSFVMFAMGNELYGPEGLVELVGHLREHDGRPLYSAGSNNNLGWLGPQPHEDFFTAARVGAETPGTFDAHARASFSFTDAEDGGYMNHTYPNTLMDFSIAAGKSSIPVIGHETGQYQIYPNYSEIEKYTGALRPRNMEIFQERLEAAGMGDLAEEFFRASGAWAAELYRADMEMNLRTYPWGGFQLLDLQDYPGQGSAFVGVLDAFMDSKGLITPEQWRQSCDEIVALACMEKYCWSSDETFSAEIRVSNFSASDLIGKNVEWSVTDASDNIVAKGCISAKVSQGSLAAIGNISFPLQQFSKASKLTLTLRMKSLQITNNYPLWVYPADNVPALPENVVIAEKVDGELTEMLADGAKVLLFPDHELYAEYSVGGLFQTDYWNYAMFKTISENAGKPVSPGTLGLLIDPGHPALADFPTEFHTEWQWFPIVKSSRPTILDSIGQAYPDYRPIVQVIDNVERNHRLGLLYEFKVGKGRLMVCAADLGSLLEGSGTNADAHNAAALDGSSSSEQDAIDPVAAGIAAAEAQRNAAAGIVSYPEARQFLSSILRYMDSEAFAPGAELTTEELYKLFPERR